MTLEFIEQDLIEKGVCPEDMIDNFSDPINHIEFSTVNPLSLVLYDSKFNLSRKERDILAVHFRTENMSLTDTAIAFRTSTKIIVEELNFIFDKIRQQSLRAN